MRVHSSGFEVKDIGYRVKGIGYRVWGIGLITRGFVNQGLGFRVLGASRVKGTGYKEKSILRV